MINGFMRLLWKGHCFKRQKRLDVKRNELWNSRKFQCWSDYYDFPWKSIELLNMEILSTSDCNKKDELKLNYDKHKEYVSNLKDN